MLIRGHSCFYITILQGVFAEFELYEQLHGYYMLKKKAGVAI